MRQKREIVKDPYLVSMGAKMRIIRRSRGINIREMGKLCNMDFTAICMIENGHYGSKITTLKLIAEVLEWLV